MLFLRQIGFLFISISVLSVSPVIYGNVEISFEFGWNWVAYLTFIAGVSIFFGFEIYRKYIKFKAYILKKHGVHIVSNKRTLSSGYVASYSGVPRKYIDRVLSVKANIPNCKREDEFESEYFWISREQSEKAYHQGAGVISAPKNIDVYYCKSWPSFHYVDVSFMDKSYFQPKNEFDWLMDGVFYMSFIALIWYGTISGYLVYKWDMALLRLEHIK